MKQSRYLEALKRTSAARSAVTRSAAVGAMLVLPLTACSNNDASVFADDAEGAVATTAASETAAGSPATTASETTITTLDGATTVLDETATSAVEATGAALFPSGAELLVDFTFEANDSGRVNNPYIAVWIEDSEGNLVKTISLWTLQSQKGTKWLSDLQRWSGVSGSVADDSVSGATKVAGSYTVAWNGTDDDGNAVEQGNYVLNIEAAREHGPYELISEPIVIAEDGFSIQMTPNGELTAASVTLSV